MKKIISLGLMLAATFALTNCAKEIDQPIQDIPEAGGIPFEIVAATSADTKTANDGMSTKWVADDAINVFYAAEGDGTFVNGGEFSITDVESNKFTGTLALSDDVALEDGEKYDWYFFYPYSKYVKTPDNTGNGYVTVGGISQTQDGNDSRAHLCNDVCPMYGIAGGVTYPETPTAEMNHLTSIVAVRVTNSTSESLVVSTVAFTATEDIVGTYYIDFYKNNVEDPDVTYTGSGTKYVSSTATLTVTDGEAIPAGSSAVFYIAIKPFTAAAGETLTFNVNGTSKDITVPEGGVTFTAGKIKTVSFNYEEVAQPITVSEVLEADVDQSVFTEGVLVAKNTSGGVIADETGYIYIYGSGLSEYELGSLIQVTGTRTNHNDFPQITTPTITLIEEGRGVSHPEPYLIHATTIDAFSYVDHRFLQFEGRLRISGNYYNVEIDGVTQTGSLANLTSDMKTAYSEFAEHNIVATGYLSSGNTSYINIFPVSVEKSTTPYLNLMTDVLNVSAEEGTTSFPIYSNETVTVTSSDETNFAAVYADGEVTITYTANTESTERTATITVTAGELSETVTITQSGVSAEGTKYYVKVTEAPLDWSGKYLLVCDTKAKTFAGFSTSSTIYGLGEDVAINDSKIVSTEGTDIYQLTISAASTTSGAYVIKFGDMYLTWTSGNSLKSSGSDNVNSNWKLSVDSGNTIILNAADNERKLQWNASSPRFACYTSTQTAVQLYKLEE